MECGSEAAAFGNCQAGLKAILFGGGRAGFLECKAAGTLPQSKALARCGSAISACAFRTQDIC